MGPAFQPAAELLLGFFRNLIRPCVAFVGAAIVRERAVIAFFSTLILGRVALP